MILDKINKPNDIKKVNPSDYEKLAEEIRRFLIKSISKTGGHLASNLGAVELTMALHLAFCLPVDKIVWDVGHQSYTHKLLTGRKDGFITLRKHGGISGFPKRKESLYDSFDTGHSSTSISAGLGLAMARDLKGENYHVISVIGDGAMTGGMAYEALNNASRMERNFIIVLNDNEMSIDENVGGFSTHLSNIRTAASYNDLKKDVTDFLKVIPVVGNKVVKMIHKTKSSIKHLMIQDMFFEDLGITYLGPVDGHDIFAMIKVFREAARLDSAVLVHVITKKGKGYRPAEKNPQAYHGVEPFDLRTGKKKNISNSETYTQIFGNEIIRLAGENPKIVAITAAMIDGTGLKGFKEKYPDRLFDVGIAEEHAVTYAAGLAAGGLKPVVAIYSSFLQRAYDQLLHDVCIQNLPVVFAIDRAGLVGADGETHQGIFDLSYLSSIPGLTVFAPKNGQELQMALKFSFSLERPIAIRYPRGTAYMGLSSNSSPIEYGKAEVIHQGSGVALLCVGSMVETGVTVCEMLKSCDIDATLVNMRFVSPVDEELVFSLADTHSLFVTMEENVLSCGFGQRISFVLSEHNYRGNIICVSIPDEYVEHGNVNELKKELGIDAESVFSRISKEISRKSSGDI